ncbi:MAG: hypothetical protein V7K32_19090 [Nostoc sp.]
MSSKGRLSNWTAKPATLAMPAAGYAYAFIKSILKPSKFPLALWISKGINVGSVATLRSLASGLVVG